MTVDPDFGTVYVNIFKTLAGINNDNSIGIEMSHAGRQVYTSEQLSSVIHLVAYLQKRYHVHNENIITHRYAQQGDHTDPVAFDWTNFLALKDSFLDKAIALKNTTPASEPEQTKLPIAAVYLQIHNNLKSQEVLPDKSLNTPAHASTPGEVTKSSSLPLRKELPVDRAAAKFISTQTSAVR